MKKKKGRKKGSRNKPKKGKVASYLVEIPLTCCKCKEIFLITTHKSKVDEVYTKEVKKRWSCGLC